MYACAAVSCTLAADLDFHFDTATSLGQTVDHNTAYVQHTTSGQSFSVQTSSEPLTNDGDGDMLLLITPVIDISLATIVRASIGPNQQCSVPAPVDAMSASADPTQQLNWIGVWEIRNRQLPLAQNLTQSLLQQNGGSSSFADANTQKAYSEAMAAQGAWEAILSANAQAKASATAFPNLVNRLKTVGQQYGATTATLNEALGSADGPRSPTAAFTTDLTTSQYLDSDQVVISFNGAEGSLAFELTGEYAAETLDASVSQAVTASAGADTYSSFDLFFFGATLKFEAAFSYTNTESASITSDATSAYTMVIELSDPDIGDQFDVAILRDSLGLPVFQTRSGRSICAPEAGTVAREALLLSASQSDFVHQDPSQPVTFTLSITNASPFQETFGYQIWHTNNPNALSFSFNGVDDGYGSNYYLLPPGNNQILFSAYRSVGSGYGNSPVTFLIQGANCSSQYYTYTATYDINVQYDTPCSQSQFAGALAQATSFAVGQTAKHAYTFVISNPNALSGDTWAANAARDSGFSIEVQWKPSGATATEWTDLTSAQLLAPFAPIAAAESLAASDSAPHEELYAFTVNWSGESAGSYDFQIVNTCTPPAGYNGATVPLYSTISPTVTMLYDPSPPAVVGDPQPFMSLTDASSPWPVYVPGQFIGATWTETLDCSHAVVSMYQAATWALLATRTTPLPTPAWVCEDNLLQVGFSITNWTALSGAFACVSAGGIVDAAGNAQTPQPLVWCFQVLPFNVTATSYRFTTLSLRSSLQDTQALLYAQRARGAMHTMAVSADVDADPYAAAVSAFQQRLQQRLTTQLHPRTQALNDINQQLQREVVQLIDAHSTDSPPTPCHWLEAQVQVEHRREAQDSLATEQLQGVELLLLPLHNVSLAEAEERAARGLPLCSPAQAAERLYGCLSSAACVAGLDRGRFPLLSRLPVPRTDGQRNRTAAASALLRPQLSFHPALDLNSTEAAQS